jgi:hypothetical protein
MLPSQTELKALLDYDPNNGVLQWKPRPRSMFLSDRSWNSWNARYANKIAFTSVDRKGYRVGAIYDRTYRASRVIFKWMTGIDADQVDHEDGDTQNNRWKNLRDVTGQQNQMNMKRASNNTSGTTGVSWNSSKKKWEAKIKFNKQTIHLGRFDNIQDAIVARKRGETKYGFHANHGR